MYVAKQCVLAKNCLKKQLGNGLRGIGLMTDDARDPNTLRTNISKTAGDQQSLITSLLLGIMVGYPTWLRIKHDIHVTYRYEQLQ